MEGRDAIEKEKEVNEILKAIGTDIRSKQGSLIPEPPKRHGYHLTGFNTRMCPWK